MSTETSTTRYTWGTHTIYWVAGRKVAFRDTYNNGDVEIYEASNKAITITEDELAALLGNADPHTEIGHYHDPEGRFDYCTDPRCPRLAGPR